MEANFVKYTLGCGLLAVSVHAFADSEFGGGHPVAYRLKEIDEPIGDFVRDDVFVGQNIESNREQTVSFSIVEGAVVSDDDSAIKISVLGAAAGRGVYVTLRPTFNSDSVNVYGDLVDVATANVNDQNNPRHYVTPNRHSAGTELTIEANSWLGVRGGQFQSYLQVDSSKKSRHVLVLRNGDRAPHAASFRQAHQMADFIRDVVELSTGKIVLNKNQAIFLFELTTANLSHSDADFDDLVVLVTFAHDPADLIDGENRHNPLGTGKPWAMVDWDSHQVHQGMILEEGYENLTAKKDVELNDSSQIQFSSLAGRPFQLFVGRPLGSSVDLEIEDLQNLVLFKKRPIQLEALAFD